MRKISLRTGLLSLLMLLLLLHPAQAEEVVTIDGVTYTVNSMNWLTRVTGGTEGATLVVPDSINGIEIHKIGGSLFQNGIFERITLPETVTHFYGNTFKNSQALVHVDLPAQVQHIDTYCMFEGCSNLTSVILPEGTTALAYHTFYECKSLKSVTLPSTLTDLGRYAFDSCSSLESITIPEGVTSIPDLTFSQCYGLKEVKLPSTLKEIGGQAFTGCSSLTTLTLPEGLTTISSWAFQASGITELHLPSTISDLSSLSLAEAYHLKKVTYTVPDDATALPEYLIDAPGLVITISEKSPLLPMIKDSGVTYIIKETGKPGNATGSVDDTIDTVEEKVQAIVAAVVTDDMSDYQKALALHNWLIRNVTYDYSLVHHTAEHMLLHGTGVCQAYTDSYALLLDAVGIPNTRENGNNHIWNMIQLDGDWYHVDCTWDDPGEGGYENCDHFCLSTQAITILSNHECFRKPHVASDYKYNYAYRTGKLNKLLNNAKEQIVTSLADGKASFSFPPQNYSANMEPLTALLVLQDTTYSVNGKTVSITIDFNKTDWQYVVTLTGMSAPDMTLPAGVTAIDAEAFAGTPLQVVRLPQGLKTIGSRAFADGSLWQIFIPSSVTAIADDAFSGVDGLIIFGKAGSTAQSYATSHGYTFIPAE